MFQRESQQSLVPILHIDHFEPEEDFWVKYSHNVDYRDSL